MGKTCVICGAPSGMYPLCIKHLKEKADEKVVKCTECNTWHEIDKPCKCKDAENETKTIGNAPNASIEEFAHCIICKKPTPNPQHPQCLACYTETRDFMSSLNKNSTTHELRDYYYNLKDSILIMKNIEIARKNCNKLMAIAIVNNKNNEDSSLSDRVVNDIKNLLSPKKPLEKEIKIVEKITEQDEKKARILTCQDGHNVKSDMEVIIDDFLWNNYIPHAYEKPIIEIDKNKKCDWFIPICNGEGIYIEYWGMSTENYLQSRKEKEELYQKHNVPYIGIEKDAPKKDTQTFGSNLIKDLRQMAEERWGFMPKWKK